MCLFILKFWTTWKMAMAWEYSQVRSLACFIVSSSLSSATSYIHIQYPSWFMKIYTNYAHELFLSPFFISMIPQWLLAKSICFVFYHGYRNYLYNSEFTRYSVIRNWLKWINLQLIKYTWDCLKLIISVDLLSSLILLRSASCRARCLMTRQGQICVI